MVFIARVIPEDSPLHAVLDQVLGKKSMVALTPSRLEDIIGKATLPAEHPVNELLLEEFIEDAALGGVQGTKKLLSRRSGRKISRTDLQQARENADDIGRLGEELVNGFLLKLRQEGSIKDFEWVSDENAIAPYDFQIITTEEARVSLDVKSTAGGFGRPVHISISQLEHMCADPERYDLYRVCEIGEYAAELIIIEDMEVFAQEVLRVFDRLPEGVKSDGISVSPSTLISTLNSQASIIIHFPDEPEEEEEG